MAILTAEGLTLIEIVKRQHNNDMLTIAETLAEENEILQDIPWVEANDIFENVSLRRASLPSGTWRKLNAGTAAEKSDTVQVTHQRLAADGLPDTAANVETVVIFMLHLQ